MQQFGSNNPSFMHAVSRRCSIFEHPVAVWLQKVRFLNVFFCSRLQRWRRRKERNVTHLQSHSALEQQQNCRTKGDERRETFARITVITKQKDFYDFPRNRQKVAMWLILMVIKLKWSCENYSEWLHKVTRIIWSKLCDKLADHLHPFAHEDVNVIIKYPQIKLKFLA